MLTKRHSVTLNTREQELKHPWGVLEVRALDVLEADCLQSLKTHLPWMGDSWRLGYLA